MIVFPPAKINIGLNIIRKRDDGFHDIETVFYPLELSDIVEVVQSSSKTEFSNTGLLVDAPATSNLCVKAYQLLKKDYNLPEVKIHLHKIIPMGAGLGGGSSDAAYVLKVLNQLFDLKISNDAMIDYASQLGSDCAFFVNGEPSLATGRGEVLSPLPLNLKGYHVLLIKPDIHISTAEAYSGVTPFKPEKSLNELLKWDIRDWKNCIVNDFEKHLFIKYPQLSDIKNFMYGKGAVYASMSGSGSTVYGIFKDEPAIKGYENCFWWKGKL